MSLLSIDFIHAWLYPKRHSQNDTLYPFLRKHHSKISILRKMHFYCVHLFFIQMSITQTESFPLLKVNPLDLNCSYKSTEMFVIHLVCVLPLHPTLHHQFVKFASPFLCLPTAVVCYIWGEGILMKLQQVSCTQVSCTDSAAHTATML